MRLKVVVGGPCPTAVGPSSQGQEEMQAVEARLVPSISHLTVPLHGTRPTQDITPHVCKVCVCGPSVGVCALNTQSLTPQVHGRHQGSRDRSCPPTNVTIPKTHPLMCGFVDGLPRQLTCEVHSWQRAFGDEEERVPVRQLL